MLSDLVVGDITQEAMLKEVKFEEANCIDNDDKRDLEACGSQGPGLLIGVVGKRARDRLRKKRARLYKVGCQDDIETVADDTGDWRQLHNGVG